MRTQLGLILAAVTLAIAPPSFAAVEPWADPGLPVRDGVTLWLDASTLNRSRQAHGLPAAITGGVVDHWPDASGPSRRVSQRIETARPVWIDLDEGRGVVRFDGKDDSLATIGPERSVEEFTLFVVAAPRPISPHSPGLWPPTPSARTITSPDSTSTRVRATSRFEALNIEGFGFGGAAT